MNDFKKKQDEVVSIEAPFNADLTTDDQFDSPRSANVKIHDNTPANFDQVLQVGLFVDTRPAPIMSETQEVVRGCYNYLVELRTRGNEDPNVEMADLEKHVGWDTTVKWKLLRSRWENCQLSKVLRQYPRYFVVTQPQGEGVWSTPMTVSLVPMENRSQWQWGTGDAGNPSDAGDETKPEYNND